MMCSAPGTNCTRLNRISVISEKNIEILRTIERLAITRYKSVPTGNNPSLSGKETSTTALQSTGANSTSMQSMGGNSGNSAGQGSNQAASPMQSNSMGSSSGSTGLSDIYRIQIEIGDVQNNIELLKNQWNTIAAQFNSYLDRSPESTVTLPDTLIADNYELSLLALSDSTLVTIRCLGCFNMNNSRLMHVNKWLQG